MLNEATSPTAVSYTHLDVYKRQAQTRRRMTTPESTWKACMPVMAKSEMPNPA